MIKLKDILKEWGVVDSGPKRWFKPYGDKYTEWEKHTNHTNKEQKVEAISIKDKPIPTKIGFKGGPDFKHGLVREFFKFFYIYPGNDQPQGTFKTMADNVHDRYAGNLDKELAGIGDISQQIHDYLQPPAGEKAAYSLHSLEQKGAAQLVWKYMAKVNKLATIVDDSVTRGGAASESKVTSGLRGVKGMLQKAHDIFTSSFGPPKHRTVGFKLRVESLQEDLPVKLKDLASTVDINDEPVDKIFADQHGLEDGSGSPSPAAGVESDTLLTDFNPDDDIETGYQVIGQTPDETEEEELTTVKSGLPEPSKSTASDEDPLEETLLAKFKKIAKIK